MAAGVIQPGGGIDFGMPEAEGRTMTTYKVGYLIGSLAKASINRKLAKALVRLAPPELADVGDPVQGSAALQL